MSEFEFFGNFLPEVVFRWRITLLSSVFGIGFGLTEVFELNVFLPTRRDLFFA